MNIDYIVGGKIKLIVGPMFSGKSTDLINTVNRQKYKNKSVVIVKYNMDNRFSSDKKIVTHDKQEFPALECQKLNEIKETLKEYDVIGIDEGQFYSDIVEVCSELSLKGKLIIVSGLSGNYLMQPFENISNLISIADKIKMKKSICYFCQGSATFSLRIVPIKDEVLIGASEMYKPACRICHEKNNKLAKFD